MSRQSADNEMKTIRRILDALSGLTPGQQKRILAYASERVSEAPAQMALPQATEVRLSEVKQ